MLVTVVEDVTGPSLTTCGQSLKKLRTSVNEEWRDIEIVEFSHHLVELKCLKSRNEIKRSLMKLPGGSR